MSPLSNIDMSPLSNIDMSPSTYPVTILCLPVLAVLVVLAFKEAIRSLLLNPLGGDGHLCALRLSVEVVTGPPQLEFQRTTPSKGLQIVDEDGI
ncbi:hypothetical protein C8A01DRAFT_40188 [Parachaetomium inaequale]|uniref:Uncharacterized protein n=1 Tax=Parachaetomium inaequale TaxID=2588326 RepID=A0AAN6SN42_9PEZI|nr:hypothetical protein C8A01DRAFT_40188 [Parachaetomium inaequale]